MARSIDVGEGDTVTPIFRTALTSACENSSAEALSFPHDPSLVCCLHAADVASPGFLSLL
jgi:hypothetical protein